jgi:DNA-directed RNA polymerase subunit RPC12/RpoP
MSVMGVRILPGVRNVYKLFFGHSKYGCTETLDFGHLHLWHHEILPMACGVSFHERTHQNSDDSRYHLKAEYPRPLPINKMGYLLIPLASFLAYRAFEHGLAFVLAGTIGLAWYRYWRKHRHQQELALEAHIEKMTVDFKAAWREHMKREMTMTRSDVKRPHDWRHRREFILERDGYRCTRCGTRTNLHVHHIVPVRQRPDHSASNLVTLCASCHGLQDGHSSGLGKGFERMTTVTRASRNGFDKRRGRKEYKCSTCGVAISKGEESFAPRAKYGTNGWHSSNARYCWKCVGRATNR